MDLLLQQTKAGKIKDLEAFAQLTEYAAVFTPTYPECFLQNLGAVLTGDTDGAAWAHELQHQLNGKAWDPNYDPNAQFGQSGFDWIFQDPNSNGGGNQAHHYWFYVQMGFQRSQYRNTPSPIFPWLAVIAHETVLYNNPAGNSFQDVALGIEGTNLGIELWAGTIQPSGVGNYLRITLSPGSNNAFEWTMVAYYFSALITNLP